MRILFYLIVISCFYYGDLKKLKNLCPENVFNFTENGSLNLNKVNSYVKLSLSILLKPLKEYQFNELILPPPFFSKNDTKKLAELKSNYDKLLFKVYNFDFIAKSNQKTIAEELLNYENLFEQIMTLFDNYKKIEKKEIIKKWKNQISIKMKNLNQLLKIVKKTDQNYLSEELYSNFRVRRALRRLIKSKSPKSEPSLNGLKIDVYYKNPLIKITNFKLRNGNKFLLSPETKARIYFDLFVPFNNFKYDEKIKESKKDCIDGDKLKKLPKFYNEKKLKE